jgi:phytoene dehydrogenase-like protein
MERMTIVGGGISGLTAAVSAAEAGFDVTLLEAKKTLGGKAWTTDHEFRANWGPHVIYSDGPLWDWLSRRGLAEPAARAPRLATIVFRMNGRRRRIPPPSLIHALRRVCRAPAPVEASFQEWAAAIVGAEHARRIANFAGVVTFDHHPGRLSAAFVQPRVRRATTFPPRVRYLPGGWATMTERLATHARHCGVDIRTDVHVDTLPDTPVILAVPLPVASSLIGGEPLLGSGTRTALLDVGLAGRHQPPFAISDLDASGWVETFTVPDPTLAPRGNHLLQGQAGMRPGEQLDDAIARIEALIDVGVPGWRDREVWRRRGRIVNETGALDLPGTTWRDRPRVDRGDGIYLTGDMVAAPGLLAEVSHTSAINAVAAVVETMDRQPVT